MPRLVRQQPLSQRLKAKFNVMDWLLWLSEEIETWDVDSQLGGTPMGLALNFVFLVARANSGTSRSSSDLFSDRGASGWLSWLASLTVWSLALFSIAMAFLTITRSRKYRLFSASVEVQLATPNARRVKTQSEMNSSPLRYFADMIAPETADSRAHPNKKTDVWELAVWDPSHLVLRLFCLFSPGHVLVYFLFFPLAHLDHQPSVTVFYVLVIQALLSGQMLFLTTHFTQQKKDQALVQKEVMHEYDTKFVHPRIHPVVREVATQTADPRRHVQEEVQYGTPATLIRRSVFSRPATESESSGNPRANAQSHQVFTPPSIARKPDAFTPSQSRPSASRQSLPPTYSSTATSTSTSAARHSDFGGNMGIHTHNKSPLKKAISMHDMGAQEQASPRNSRELASYEQERQSSPLKGSTRPNPFAPSARSASSQQPRERFPSRSGYY